MRFFSQIDPCVVLRRRKAFQSFLQARLSTYTVKISRLMVFQCAFHKGAQRLAPLSWLSLTSLACGTPTPNTISDMKYDADHSRRSVDLLQ